VENLRHDFPKEYTHLLYRDGNNLPLHGLLLKSDQWKTQFTHQHAKFSLNNLDILFDEHYAFAQVYAPLNTDKPYVCIEPMTASTNALNTNSCPTILPNQSFNAIFSIQINE
jgi:galactose mutarotase-like enzyme